MAITGVGIAEKDRVRQTMVRAHRVEGVPAQPDAVDAAAVALCHLHQSRMRRAGAVGAP
jgi:Holliday junction resolvasome RuvABC endonuclease subunit